MGFLWSDGRRFFFHKADVCGTMPTVGMRVSFIADAPNRPGQEMKAVSVKAE